MRLRRHQSGLHAQSGRCASWMGRQKAKPHRLSSSVNPCPVYLVVFELVAYRLRKGVYPRGGRGVLGSLLVALSGFSLSKGPLDGTLVLEGEERERRGFLHHNKLWHGLP